VPGALTAGSPVRIGGIDVGAVTRVTRGPGRPVVTVRIDHPRAAVVRADARLAIRERILTKPGAYYVDLKPGARKPPLPSGSTIGATPRPFCGRACKRRFERFLRKVVKDRETRRYLRRYRRRHAHE
jgi:hypothetical protein